MSCRSSCRSCLRCSRRSSTRSSRRRIPRWSYPSCCHCFRPSFHSSPPRSHPTTPRTPPRTTPPRMTPRTSPRTTRPRSRRRSYSSRSMTSSRRGPSRRNSRSPTLPTPEPPQGRSTARSHESRSTWFLPSLPVAPSHRNSSELLETRRRANARLLGTCHGPSGRHAPRRAQSCRKKRWIPARCPGGYVDAFCIGRFTPALDKRITLGLTLHRALHPTLEKRITVG
jgi:hypothetical protein